MLKTIRVLLVFTFVVSLGGASAEQKFDAATLSEKIYAVHASAVLPTDGTLKVAEWAKQWPLPEGLFPDFRCTLHFALGELVRPVEGVCNWDSRPYAVVTPLKTLLPQAVNINCYDTFILGDFKLVAESTLVMPRQDEATVSDSHPYKVHFYDSTSCTLRQAVDEVIAKENGWHISMNSLDNEDELNEALLYEENVNTLAFFEPLLEERPWISVGLRWQPHHGEGYLFGKVESRLYQLLFLYVPIENYCPCCEQIDLTDEAVIEMRNGLVIAFESICNFVSNLPFSDEAKNCFNKKYFGSLVWLNILDVDLHLRKNYGRTLQQADDEIWKLVAANMNDVDALLTICESNLEHIPEKKAHCYK